MKYRIISRSGKLIGFIEADSEDAAIEACWNAGFQPTYLDWQTSEIMVVKARKIA